MEEKTYSNFIHDIIDDDLREGRADHVHTRFPPEPNGYLHIGSAKAIWINYTTAKKYGGKFNLRYDDTNPVKEDDEYVQAIEEDLHWLGADPDGIFYGSDYFDRCYELAVELIKKGLAYVDDLTQEEIGEYRGPWDKPGKDSPYRNRSIEENLDLFERMKNGEFADGEKTLRAKIDNSASNMNMRDPVIYRILHTSHHRQGTKWCIYPMYDFAHPLQDAIEGITHSLCSIEFENHRPLYEWFVDHCGSWNPKPKQREFARLDMTYTVMSKRYLRALVESGAVDGWDDPRMPTLCGLRRRGYSPSAIFDFIERSGVAKAKSLVDAQLLEYCVCSELNDTAQRRVAVTEPLKVVITNYPSDKTEYFNFPNHPKNEALGSRALPFTNELYIERSDFMPEKTPGFHRLIPGGEVRLMNAYFMRCDDVVYGDDGEIKELLCSVDLETGNGNPMDGRKVKGTVHWLSAKHAILRDINVFGNLFNDENVASLIKDDTLAEFINPDSKKVLKNCALEESLEGAKSGERFQFVRMGYFTPDSKIENTFNRIAPLKSAYKPE